MKTMKDKLDTWCVNANHALSGNNNGSTKICCMHTDYEKDMQLGVETIDQCFNKEEIRNIRQSLNNGVRHKACRLCWEEEDAGRYSKRLRDNERYQWLTSQGQMEPYVGLAKVELNLGNTCNLSCRTCQAAISSGWYKEDYELFHKDKLSFKEYADTLKKYNLRYADDSPFWPDIEKHLPTIKQFDFYGGEPFMIKKQWNLLRKAVELGYSKDIELHYNTNGTHWPKDIELWKHFKNVNLSFSIDGIGEQFEYMRYPAKWDDAKQNMENSILCNQENQNMNLSWCVTISNINVFDLPATLEYWHQNYSHFGLYLNLVHGPEIFNISNMPDRYKEEAVKILESVPQENEKAWTYLHGIINFIKNGTPRDDLWPQFLSSLKLHDDYRKQRFQNTWPTLAKLVEANE